MSVGMFCLILLMLFFGSGVFLLLDLMVRLTEDEKHSEIVDCDEKFKIDSNTTFVKEGQSEFKKSVNFQYKGKTHNISVPLSYDHNKLEVNITQKKTYYRFSKEPIIVRMIQPKVKRIKTDQGYTNVNANYYIFKLLPQPI